ncbi:unnamed protein product [Closterium sp. NIES-54]
MNRRKNLNYSETPLPIDFSQSSEELHNKALTPVSNIFVFDDGTVIPAQERQHCESLILAAMECKETGVIVELGAWAGQYSRCLAAGLYMAGRHNEGRLFSFDTFKDSSLREKMDSESQLLRALSEATDLDIMGDRTSYNAMSDVYFMEDLVLPDVTTPNPGGGRKLLNKAKTMAKLLRKGEITPDKLRNSGLAARNGSAKNLKLEFFGNETLFTKQLALRYNLLLTKPCKSMKTHGVGRSILAIWQAAVLPVDPSATPVPGLYSEVRLVLAEAWEKRPIDVLVLHGGSRLSTLVHQLTLAGPFLHKGSILSVLGFARSPLVVC